MPTPELAPSTSTVCPGRTPASPTSMCHAVTKTSGTLAAWLKSSASGIGNHVGCRHGNQLAVAAVDRIAEHGEFAALVLQSGEAFRAVSAKMHGRDQHALAGFEIR